MRLVLALVLLVTAIQCRPMNNDQKRRDSENEVQNSDEKENKRASWYSSYSTSGSGSGYPFFKKKKPKQHVYVVNDTRFSDRWDPFDYGKRDTKKMNAV